MPSTSAISDAAPLRCYDEGKSDSQLPPYAVSKAATHRFGMCRSSIGRKKQRQFRVSWKKGSSSSINIERFRRRRIQLGNELFGIGFLQNDHMFTCGTNLYTHHYGVIKQRVYKLTGGHAIIFKGYSFVFHQYKVGYCYSSLINSPKSSKTRGKRYIISSMYPF